MKKYNKHALIAFTSSLILPPYIYMIVTNFYWPDLTWGTREWHQVLATQLLFVPSVTILTYVISKFD